LSDRHALTCFALSPHPRRLKQSVGSLKMLACQFLLAQEIPDSPGFSGKISTH
jgi:hypothetical protein